MNDLLPLITNLSTRNRDYVVFVGAGFSKDAGVKSGWDILIETLKPLYVDEAGISELPEDYYSKIENWYLSHEKYSTLGYSDILELFYKGEIERREYLRTFFASAQPGEAHRQLALTVKNQLIRFVFTTNFDDLIEKALDELGIDYDVIFSDDILAGSKSWDKVKTCRIYKMHGDYKTGKVKNTINELKQVDPGMSDDFQYIIDRHGLVVIGYAGRDEGIMTHFLKRKPFHYPFYWQYVNRPPKIKDFELYYRLFDLYANEYKREIHLIQCDSASRFLADINSGLEKLERAIIVSKSEKDKYKSYIVNQNAKKIRALTLELYNKYSDLYHEYRSKEALDNHFDYMYEIFTEFLSKTGFVFDYVDALLTYDQAGEAKYLTLRILELTTDVAAGGLEEFMGLSTPYYILMNCGALFLKHGKPDIMEDYYGLRIKRSSGSYAYLMEKISLAGQGWDYIAKEKFKQNFFLKKYTIIGRYLLPGSVSVRDFNFFDAYVTLDLALRNLPYNWVCGSSIYDEDFSDAFHKYFENKVANKEQADLFIKNLFGKYGKFDSEILEGIERVADSLKRKYP